MKSTIFLCLIVFLILACGKTEKQKTLELSPSKNIEVLTILDKGVKTFPIASDASFEHLNQPRVTVLNGKEYFSFSYYQMFDMFLYLYDYDTGEIINKMTFVTEGPNAFNASIGFNYFFHTLDSVFVGSISGDYAIMNEKAEIVQRIGRNQSGTFRSEIKFDETSYYDGTLIHTPTNAGFPYRDIDLQYAWATLELKIDLNLQRVLPSRNFIRDFDEITTLRKAATTKAGYQSPLQRSLNRSGDTLYASSPISDSIFVFDQNYKLINTLYSGIPGVDVTDYKAYLKMMQVKFFKGGMGGEIILNKPPHFVQSVIDPQGKFIYRVLIEETKGKYSERTNEEIPVITRARLIVINLASEDLYTHILPLDEIDIGGSFVSNAGMHFRVKGQEDEDQVQFKVFGIDYKH